jgi:hypothetical protein
MRIGSSTADHKRDVGFAADHKRLIELALRIVHQKVL